MTLKSILFFHDFDILLQKEALSVTLAFRAIFFLTKLIFQNKNLKKV